MPILNPIETLMKIRELCEDMEEQSAHNFDIKLAKDHDKLITTIQDLCDDTLTDIASEILSPMRHRGMAKKGQQHENAIKAQQV